MANVLLISETKLKSFTNINKNVDMDLLKAEIKVAQDIDLQTALGTKFYNHLCNQVTSSGNTFNANELTLVNDYIAPFLIHAAYHTAIPHIHYRTMNRGIMEGEAESARGVDIETLKYLRNVQRQRADFYQQRMLDWLMTGAGQNLFPDWNNTSSYDGMVPDKTAKYNAGIVLNHTTRKGYAYKNLNLPSYSEIDKSDGPCCD
jgi:hypothetical protein